MSRMHGMAWQEQPSRTPRSWWWRAALAVAIAVTGILSMGPADASAQSATICASGVIVFNSPCPSMPPNPCPNGLQAVRNGGSSGSWSCPPTDYKTRPLTGSVAGANQQTAFCPGPGYVWGLDYYSDPINGRTGGVRLLCKTPSNPFFTAGPSVGS